MRFLVLPQHELAKFCLKPVSETQYISSSCTLCCMLSKLYASFTIKCIKNVLWPTNRKFIYFSKWFHAVLYIALENHVPLRRFPETFSMWYRIVFGTKLHRFHYCCNLWWVQPLYCINTLDYKGNVSALNTTLKGVCAGLQQVIWWYWCNSCWSHGSCTVFCLCVNWHPRHIIDANYTTI